MDKKTVTSAIGTFLAALLAMAAVTFAWFAISHDASTEGFVNQVGTLETSYEFAQIKEGEFTPEHQDGKFDNKEVIPGSSFIFTLIVKDEGDIDGTVSVDLTGVKSFIVSSVDADGDYNVSEEYDDLRKKIQYSFSYSVMNVYWVPNDTISLNGNVDQKNPLPTQEELINRGWKEFTDEEKRQYYINPIEENGKIICDDITFNNYYTNSEGKQVDSTSFRLLNDVYVYGRDQVNNPNIADAKTAFIVYFKITYENEIELPEYLKTQNYINQYGEYVYNPDVYENQLLGIESVMIIAEEETDEN